jgi:hypothetical protein
MENGPIDIDDDAFELTASEDGFPSEVVDMSEPHPDFYNVDAAGIVQIDQ